MSYLGIHHPSRPLLALSLSCVLSASGGTSAEADTVVPVFSLADFSDRTTFDNPYFPLFDGWTVTLAASGIDEEGEYFTEKSELSYGGLGPEILGVQTTIQHDLAYEDGRVVEETFDYYAQDNAGNVWYFGEDVANFIYDDDGVLIETNNESAWIAGENGALPGYIMPANPLIGFAYYQEVAVADDALDQALIQALGLTVTSGGSVFEDVLRTFETTELDPDAREFKYYAPGFGLIRVEEGLDLSFSNPELVFELTPVPLPPALSLLFAGLGILGAPRALRRRKPS
jgi:hypothetical protein